MQGCLTFQKLTKNLLIYSVSYFNLGVLGLCFGGLSPPKPPVTTGLNIVQYDLALSFTRDLGTTRYIRTLALLCRIFCAKYATSTALHSDSTHAKRNTISSTQLCRCRPHMNENNSHESEMVPIANAILTQRQVGC